MKSDFICSKHNKKTDYLHYRQNQTDQILKCFDCGIYEHLEFNNLMYLSDILSGNCLQINLTSFQLGGGWKNRLFNFLNSYCSEESIQLINAFYEDLQKEVIEKMHERKKEDLIKAEQLQKQYEAVISKCEEITSSQQLIDIFKSHQSNTPSLNEELKQFFLKQQDNQKDNQKDVKEAVEEFERLFSYYDDQKPSFQKELVIKQLQSLTFFSLNEQDVKTVEDIPKQLPIFLANQTEYLSQILKDTASFFQSPPLNFTSFKAAKIGKQAVKIKSEIDDLYLQKQKELEEQISQNYLSKQILDEIKTAPLKYKFNCLANLINTIPTISAIDILKQKPGEIKFEMIKSNYAESQQTLEISNQNQQGFIEVKKIQDGNGQCFTNFTLMTDINYLLSFKIVNNKSQNKCQSVGLCLDNIKDSDHLQSQNLCYAGWGAFGLTKKIKGQDLYQEMKVKQEYKIQMQICLKDRKLICYDIPDKKSICQISEDKIDPKGIYRLGIRMFFNEEKVEILSFQIVEKFLDF